MLNFCRKLIDTGKSYSEVSLNQPTTVVLITVSFVQVTITDNNGHARNFCMLNTTRSTTISNDEVFLGLISESTNSTSKK